MRRLASIGVGAAVATLCIAVGAAATALWVAPATPETLSRADRVDTVPVVMQPFDDARSVDLAVKSAGAVSLTSSTGGRVTSVNCDPGVELVSGQVNFALDGAPVVNLATSTPLWRDLKIGDSGADVLSLQQELARLGVDVVADGELGATSTRAFASIAGADAAQARQATAIPLGSVLWLPAERVTATTCGASLGAALEPGGVLAEAAGPPITAEILAMPDDLITGPRTLRVDDVVVHLDAEGRVVDFSERAALSATGSVKAALSAEQPTPVAGIILLEEPIQVGTVPPGAVYGASGDEACILAEGGPVPVKIVGSQLGQTYVMFAAGPPDTVSVDPGRKAPPCR